MAGCRFPYLQIVRLNEIVNSSGEISDFKEVIHQELGRVSKGLLW
jgi:hypothetical protein